MVGCKSWECIFGKGFAYLRNTYMSPLYYKSKVEVTVEKAGGIWEARCETCSLASTEEVLWEAGGAGRSANCGFALPLDEWVELTGTGRAFSGKGMI